MGYSFQIPGKAVVTKYTVKTADTVATAMCREVSKKLALVMFWAGWCSHCQRMQSELYLLDFLIDHDPTVKAAVTFLRVEEKSLPAVVAKCPRLKHIKVVSWPTIMLVRPSGEFMVVNARNAHDIDILATVKENLKQST